MAAVGIPAGYFTCDGSINIESSISWRLPFIFHPYGGYWYHLGCQLPLPTAVAPLALCQRSEKMPCVQYIASVFLRRRSKGTCLSLPLAGNQRYLLGKQCVQFSRGSIGLEPTILDFFVLGMNRLSGIDGVLYVRVSLKLLNPRLIARVLPSFTIANSPTTTVCSYSLLPSRSI